MKKKLLALFLVAAMSIGSFAGCAAPAKDAAANANDAKTTDTAKPADTAATAAPAETDKPADAATTDSSGEKVLRLAISNEPPNMDPQTSTDQISGEIGNSIYEGLVRVHDGKIEPGMAEKWEISADGLTYTFHLRDAKWSDGQPVTAKDFEFAYKRLLNPDTASEYAFQGYYIKGGEEYNTKKGTADQVGVKAIDDKTFEVVLNTPTSYFLSLTGFSTFYPTRQDVYDKLKEKYANEPANMVFNGPFTMTTWEHENQVILEKNPNYWNKDAIKLDKIELPIIVESKTAVGMYEDGSLDSVGLSKDFVDKYKASGDAKFYYDGAEMYFEINQVNKDETKKKLLNNKNFRKALGFALDRKGYIDTVLKNNSDPAVRYNFSQLAGPEAGKKFVETYPLEFYPANADLAKAKEFLAKACEETGIALDKLPAIEYLTDDSEAVRIMAEAIQSMMKELGVTFEIKQVPFKERLARMTAKDFDIVGALWGPDYDDVMTFMDLWVTDGGNNNTGWSNKEYDDNVFGAKKEVDAKKRGDMLFAAEKVLLDEAVIIPIYFRRVAYVEQPYISGIIRNAIGASRDYVYADVNR